MVEDESSRPTGFNPQMSQSRRYMPKVIGVSRVRNEAEIIGPVLDNVATFVDEIIMYDDASTDDTKHICCAHPAVVEVIEGKEWGFPPDEHEGQHRNLLCHTALEKGAEWVLIFDADDYHDFSEIDLSTAKAIKMRAFDLYITPEDVDKTVWEREWIGPEYRDVMVLIKMHEGIRFAANRGREPWGTQAPRTRQGYIKHIGKGVSVERWERLCDFYATHYGVYAKKWAARKGKAIHTMSDFGRPLIKWSDRMDESKIVPLQGKKK